MLAACSLPMPFAIHPARSIQGPTDSNCLHLPEVPGKKGFVGFSWKIAGNIAENVAGATLWSDPRWGLPLVQKRCRALGLRLKSS